MDTTMLTVLLTLCLTCALMSLVVTVFFPRQSVSRYTAVIFFALYFLTAHFANALEVRTILFFVAGVFLLVVEVFILGFGLAGMAGIGLVLVSGALAAPSSIARRISINFYLSHSINPNPKILLQTSDTPPCFASSPRSAHSLARFLFPLWDHVS